MIRLLTKNDYSDYLNLISELKPTFFTLEQFEHTLSKLKNNIEIWVLEENGILISSGTIIFEDKFIHNISVCGHIEDIIVKKEWRQKGYSKILINHLVKQCEEKGCYKIILDCVNELNEYYSKFGFENKNIQMSKYYN
tara:strand:+ start:1078 stop:1491 length:414 start_codon:yes stop_codon:yes gene_type:complete